MKVANSINCLQTVSLTKTYLLPSISVRDIIPFSPLDEAKKKHYFLGMCTWGEKKLPMIDLSLEKNKIDITPLTHIMVVQCPTSRGVGLVGTLISQIPRSIVIHPDDLVFQGEPHHHLYEVRGEYIDAIIVDLSALGEKLLETSYLLFES